MNTTQVRPTAHTSQANHEAKQAAATQREQEELRNLVKIEITDAEAAALLVLLGNEICHQWQTGESHSDRSFGDFIAGGIAGITYQLATQIHANHNKPQSC